MHSARLVKPYRFREELPSDTQAVMGVQHRVARLLELLGYSVNDIFSVRLAVEEALVNAIKHGNRFDPSKIIRVTCSVGPEKVHIEIEDCGNGFCPDELPVPTTNENVGKSSGRGVLLMRAFMNHVEFNERGNRVIMEKDRGQDSWSTSPSTSEQRDLSN